MGKIVKVDLGKGKRIRAKKMAHGSEKMKRKPNSPIVQRKLREKANSQFGKDPQFRKDIYGIIDEVEE